MVGKKGMQFGNVRVFRGDKKFQPELKMLARAGKNMVEPDGMGGKNKTLSPVFVNHLKLDDLVLIVVAGIKKMVAAGAP